MKKLNILYEDKYLIIVYKRHGLLTISRDNHNDLNLYDEVKVYEKRKIQGIRYLLFIAWIKIPVA